MTNARYYFEGYQTWISKLEISSDLTLAFLTNSLVPILKLNQPVKLGDEFPGRTIIKRNPLNYNILRIPSSVTQGLGLIVLKLLVLPFSFLLTGC